MLRSLLILLLVAGPALAQTPAPPVVLLPEQVSPPTPKPVPTPGQPVLLTGDALYVARSAVDCLLLVSTTDAGKQGGSIVKVTCDTGPVKIRARFVDGTAVETRTFTEKYVWLIEGVGAGTVELLWVPKSPTVAASDVVRRTITTNLAPQPPPAPVDPPTPVTPPDPLTATLAAALAKETAADKLLLPKLAALYKQSATLAADTSVATAGDLLMQMHTAAQSLVGTGLPNVRAAIGVELKAVLPTAATAVLDAPTRAAAAVEFARLAQILGALK